MYCVQTVSLNRSFISRTLNVARNLILLFQKLCSMQASNQSPPLPPYPASSLLTWYFYPKTPKRRRFKSLTDGNLTASHVTVLIHTRLKLCEESGDCAAGMWMLYLTEEEFSVMLMWVAGCSRDVWCWHTPRPSALLRNSLCVISPLSKIWYFGKCLAERSIGS